MNRNRYQASVALLFLLAAPAIANPTVVAASQRRDETRNPAQFGAAVPACNHDIKAPDAADLAVVADIISARAPDDPMVSYSAATEIAGTPMDYRQVIGFSQAVSWSGPPSKRAQPSPRPASRSTRPPTCAPHTSPGCPEHHSPPVAQFGHATS